jgi:hypothetical protein
VDSIIDCTFNSKWIEVTGVFVEYDHLYVVTPTRNFLRLSELHSDTNISVLIETLDTIRRDVIEKRDVGYVFRNTEEGDLLLNVNGTLHISDLRNVMISNESTRSFSDDVLSILDDKIECVRMNSEDHGESSTVRPSDSCTKRNNRINARHIEDVRYVNDIINVVFRSNLGRNPSQYSRMNQVLKCVMNHFRTNSNTKTLARIYIPTAQSHQDYVYNNTITMNFFMSTHSFWNFNGDSFVPSGEHRECIPCAFHRCKYSYRHYDSALSRWMFSIASTSNGYPFMYRLDESFVNNIVSPIQMMDDPNLSRAEMEYERIYINRGELYRTMHRVFERKDEHTIKHVPSRDTKRLRLKNDLRGSDVYDMIRFDANVSNRYKSWISEWMCTCSESQLRSFLFEITGSHQTPCAIDVRFSKNMGNFASHSDPCNKRLTLFDSNNKTMTMLSLDFTSFHFTSETR